MLIFAGFIFAALMLSRMLKSVDSFTPDNIIIVNQDKANLYSLEDESSFVLVPLDKGDKLVWKEDKGIWTKATQGQFTGFIKTEKVDKSAVFKER